MLAVTYTLPSSTAARLEEEEEEKTHSDSDTSLGRAATRCYAQAVRMAEKFLQKGLLEIGRRSETVPQNLNFRSKT